MRLYLMRHGEAEPGLDYDSNRSLTARGHENNLSVARQWRTRITHMPIAFCSPFLRAQQTAADLRSIIPGLEFTSSDWLLPSEAIATVFNQLSAASKKQVVAIAGASNSSDVNEIAAQDILLIGLNPLLSQVWNKLLDADGQRRFGLSTSHLVSIDAAVLASACGSFVYTVSP